MNIARMTATGGMVLAMTLGGCSSLQTARDRLVKAPAACPNQSAQIYFEPDSAEITPEGRQVILGAAQAADGCVVKSVDVLGLADAAGAPQANLELSAKRARAVTDVLTAAGLPAAEFKLAAAGQSGALTSDGESRPLRRRADIIMYLHSPKR